MTGYYIYFVWQIFINGIFRTQPIESLLKLSALVVVFFYWVGSSINPILERRKTDTQKGWHHLAQDGEASQ